MLYRIIIVILTIARFLSAFGGIADSLSAGTDVSKQLRTTLDYLYKNASAADDVSKIGEWTIISLCSADRDKNELRARYLDYITKRVRNEVPCKTPTGTLHEHKATENAKAVLALCAIGADPADIGGYDLTAPLRDVDWVCSGTINGPIFSLLALEESATDDTDTKDRLADYILECQIPDGGWALSGKKADPDITAMALQSLSIYAGRHDVVSASRRAIDALSGLQQENGGYRSYGRENSESVSQVIIALCAWGIDVREDDRFIKNGKSLIDVLSEYRVSDGGFSDTPDQDTSSLMASEQAALALSALEKFENGN